MPLIDASLTRLKVYLLLVDPVEGKLPQKLVARRLGLSKGTVSGYVKILEAEGYIRCFNPTETVKFYAKGKNAHLLDRVCLERGVRVGAGSATTCSGSGPPGSGLLESSSTQVTDVRVHANGGVHFNVIKAGDLHELLVREPGRDDLRVALFGRTPIIPPEKGHGAALYQASVWYAGERIKLHYWLGKGKETLIVWPPAAHTTPDRLPASQEDLRRVMETKARDVANYLSKWGRWQLGIGEFKGKVEMATQDERILAQIPEDIRRVQGIDDVWVDTSEGKGKRELETSNAEKARLIFDFPATRNKVDGQDRRIYTLESNVDRVISLLEKLAKAAELEAEVNAATVNRNAIETASKVMTSKAEAKGAAEAAAEDPPPPDKWSVMYG